MAEPDPSAETVPFWPIQVMREVRVSLALVGLILVVAVVRPIFQVHLGDPADPMVTPSHTKPEWYFLALYQLLKFIPKTLGAVIPVALVGLLFVWPFIDRRRETTRRPTQVRFVFTIIAAIVLVIMTVWGGM